MFSPARVIGALAATFGVDPSPCITFQEDQVFKRFRKILEDGKIGRIYFEDEDSEHEVTEDREDSEWDPSDEQDSSTFAFGSSETRKQISGDEVLKAIEYLREPQSGSRSLASMSNRFRWIKSDSDMRKLRRIEKEGKLQRPHRIRELGVLLFDKFVEKRKEGTLLDDDGIRGLGEEINFQRKLVDGFVFSHNWLNGWKRAFGVTQRRATKIVSVVSNKNQDAIKDKGKKFVEEARAEMQNFPLYAVINADQSGFVKEMMSSRTMDFKGAKTVVLTAQSKTATVE